MTAPAIRMTGVDKVFGATVANRGASLEVPAGQIHALVGENGAGKSTLMRVLAGMYRPDGGTVAVEGRDVTGWSTGDAIRAGVGMVHQHFMLVPTLTVAENLVLGREPTTGGLVDRDRAIADVRALCDRTGLKVEPTRLVSELSVGEAQRVEILKVLYRGARILVLDEPTAVLSPPEVDELWRVLRGLRDAGSTVVVITHKLDEVMAISQAITVMRRGETVDHLETAATTPAAIARAMVGRDVVLPEATGAAAVPTDAPVLLELADLAVRDARGLVAVDGVSLQVRAGEILGIAGVEGNGQTELIEAIAGLRPATRGSITLGGRAITALPVRDRAAAGLSHVPEDRHRRGLVLDWSIAENLILGQHHGFAGALGAMDAGKVRSHAEAAIKTFDIRPTDPDVPARALSGGNQQKIVIAREMGRDFRVLLASQPTRGVDVGAIEFIHAQLRSARDAGKAVLLVSADLTEILALSDRVAVLYEGKVAAMLDKSEATRDALGRHMTGAAEVA